MYISRLLSALRITILGIILLFIPSTPIHASEFGMKTDGNRIVDLEGNNLQLFGVWLPSGEWNPHFEGPVVLAGQYFQPFQNMMNAHLIEMQTRGLSIVRVSLNQSFLLCGPALTYHPQIPGVAVNTEYLERIRFIRDRTQELGMYVIFDLHWSNRGSCANQAGQQKLPDRQSLTFAKVMAHELKNHLHAGFELYNEPHDVDDQTLVSGSLLRDHQNRLWKAVGLEKMCKAFRGAGAENVVFVGGNNWAFDISGIHSNFDCDNVVYSIHPYAFGGKNTEADWDRAFGDPSASVPVAITEMGDNANCNGFFEKSIVEYAKRKSLPIIVGGAWFPEDAGYPLVCGFPSLLKPGPNRSWPVFGGSEDNFLTAAGRAFFDLIPR